MTDTAITRILGRRVWDSRGRPTVEAEVHLAGGASGRAIAPAGASTGSGEAVDRRDGGSAFGGLEVRHAVAAVNGEIADALASADLVVVENLCSLPLNPPAAAAVAQPITGEEIRALRERERLSQAAFAEAVGF